MWCETYWLPEADLVRLGRRGEREPGCVLQTHLFHDRVMSMSTVDLDHGATMGPHGVILPAASIGADATVGPSSLVMRGEHVPAGTRWAGNPIAPWADATSAATATPRDGGPRPLRARAGQRAATTSPATSSTSTYRVTTNLLMGRARITAVATAAD